MKKRLFSFGCSFVSGNWVSVPDIVGINFDEHYNYGISGSCNTMSMYRLMEADSFHNFNPESDYVLVGCTGIGRHSLKISFKNWHTHGDICPFSNEHHPKEITRFAKELFNLNHGVYASYIAFKYIRYFLKSKNINHTLYPSLDNLYFLKVLDDLTVDKEFEIYLKNLYDMLDIRESVDQLARALNLAESINFKDGWNDNHPSIQAHFEYVKKYFPQFINAKVVEVVQKQINNFNYDSASAQSAYFNDSFKTRYRTPVHN